MEGKYMKKKSYVKPQLYCESFVLAQHIAGCNLKLNSASANECTANGTISWGNGLNDSSSMFFTSSNTNCSPTVDVYCYTNGSLTQVTVNS